MTNIYDKAYSRDKRGIKYSDYGELAINLLHRYNCKKLLDLGCGQSMITLEASKFCNVTGLDISEVALKPMKELGLKNAVFVVGDCRALPFPDCSFDVIVAAELIEHLTKEDGVKLLLEAKRVLQPGGKLIITTPIRKNALIQFYNRTSFRILDLRGSWTHIHEYNVLELFEAMVKSFKIVYFSKMSPAKLLFGLLNIGERRQVIIGEKNGV